MGGMSREPQILACSGLLYPPEDYPQEWAGAQAWQAMRLSLSGARSPRFCLIATATGDSKEYIDAVLPIAKARGAAVASHLALFPQPNVPDVRAHLLDQDVIFVSGGSAVNLLAVWRAHRLDEIIRECWEAGVVLAGQSNGVHDDLTDQPRRERYRSLVASGELPAGYATEDGTALHYAGTELREALAVWPGRRAWHVEPDGAGGYAETPIEARPWTPPR